MSEATPHPTAGEHLSLSSDPPIARAPKFSADATERAHAVLSEAGYTEAEKQEVYDTYFKDFWSFCCNTLGYGDLIEAEHKPLCEEMDKPGHKLILMPRYSFKSSICTIGYTLWRLYQDETLSLRILIYSHSNAKAEEFLAEIKHHILGLKPQSVFRTMVGHWESDPKQGKWNQAAITIGKRQVAHAEPSVDTAGIETGKVGAHYDIIIFDDMVAKENVTTPDLLQKTKEVYKSALSLLRPGGQLIVVGTRWHFADLYGTLLQDKSAGFSTHLRKAEVDGTYPFAAIGLTPQFLAQQKAQQGSSLWSMLYQNEPVDDETATFKPSHFRFYQLSRQTESFKQWVSQLYITCVLDPIPPPTSDHGDDAAITVVGTDAEHTMYLLDAVAGRLTPEQQLEEVFSLHAAWGFRKLGVETNAFQRILSTMLEQRLRELRWNPRWAPFSIVEFSGLTQGNKEQRIQGLQPWHERGLIRFPGEKLETLTGVWEQLAWQMLQFPHSQKDDLVDSLAYHLQLKQAGTVTMPPQAIPYGSAAWAAEQERKEELVVMQRRPRWQRRPVPELVWA